MLISLAEAPAGVPLILSDIPDQGLAVRLGRLGLSKGTFLLRLDEDPETCPVKVKGSLGEVVLSAGLAAKVVMHLDDGRKIPLPECAPGDTGHVEGLTGHETAARFLEALGVVENDLIVFLRRLPPMTYATLVNGQRRVRLNEGLASKLLGESAQGSGQFSSATAGEPFRVTRILAGKKGRAALSALGVGEGAVLELSSVASGQAVGESGNAPIVCETRDGLRLYLDLKAAEGLAVEMESRNREAEEPAQGA